MMVNPGAPVAWTAYIDVDDINSATEKAVSIGAEKIIGPHEVPNMGWFTILKDPTGATIAIWQAK